jgi:hypothetical protein
MALQGKLSGSPKFMCRLNITNAFSSASRVDVVKDCRTHFPELLRAAKAIYNEPMPLSSSVLKATRSLSFQVWRASRRPSPPVFSSSPSATPCPASAPISPSSPPTRSLSSSPTSTTGSSLVVHDLSDSKEERFAGGIARRRVDWSCPRARMGWRKMRRW